MAVGGLVTSKPPKEAKTSASIDEPEEKEQWIRLAAGRSGSPQAPALAHRASGVIGVSCPGANCSPCPPHSSETLHAQGVWIEKSLDPSSPIMRTGRIGAEWGYLHDWPRDPTED